MPGNNTVYINDGGSGTGWSGDGSEGGSSGNQTNTLIVKYFANGATGNPPSYTTKTYSGAAKYLILRETVKSPGSSMSKSGYKFIGWNMNSSATTSQYNPGDKIEQSWNAGVSGTVTKNLYAIWVQADQFIYRPDEYANEQGYDKYGPKPLNQATTLSEALYTRDGYTQTGWILENGTHVGDVGESYTATTSGDLILYPEWAVNFYTLTFKPNGVEGSDIVMTVLYGSTITIPNQYVYFKDGYHIDNWNENSNGKETAWYPGINYVFNRTSDLTLYATWAGNEYYVVYDTDPNDPVTEIKKVVNYPHCKVDNGTNYIYSYDGTDYMTYCTPQSWEQQGVTFTWDNNGNCSVSGTSTGSPSFSNIYGNKTALPNWLEKGRHYRVEFSGVNVFMQAWFYKNEEYYAEYDEKHGNFIFEVPTDAEGFIIRLRVTEGDSVDENVSVKIYLLDFFLDSNNMLYTAASGLMMDPSMPNKYSTATYGSIFYTNYTPDHSDNIRFAGWKTLTEDLLVKTDYCLDSYSLSSNGIWNIKQDVILRPIWSNEFSYKRIFYGRRESLDYDIVIEEFPDYYWPSREYEYKKIKGRNGDVFTDPNRYENVKKIYKVAAYDGNGFRSIAPKVSNFLHRYNGYPDYIRLEDDYEPDVYMMAVYEEANSLTNLLNQAGRAEIAFNCKPQKYLRSGDTRIDVTNSGFTINNPTDYPSLPIIRILGSGNVRIKSYPNIRMLGGALANDPGTAEMKTVDLTIYNNFNEIIFDSESFTATDVNGRNMNPYITLMERIALYPGSNVIEYDGDIIKISIIPKWWRL